MIVESLFEDEVWSEIGNLEGSKYLLEKESVVLFEGEKSYLDVWKVDSSAAWETKSELYET